MTSPLLNSAAKAARSTDLLLTFATAFAAAAATLVSRKGLSATWTS
jgi:hypothetical protein